MARTQLHLRLRPIGNDGALTWLSLSGPLVTETQHALVRRLLTTLALLHGEPVRVALSAAEPVGWCEIWIDNLCHVPERHLDVRILRLGRCARSETGCGAKAQLSLFPETTHD